MNDPQNWSQRTRAAQALGRIDEATGGLVPPLHVTTTFIRDPAYADWSRPIYGRPDNQTVREAEALIGSLEGAAATFVFGSGMSAAIALFLSLGPGARIVAPRRMYWALRHWLKDEAANFGLEVAFADPEDLAALAACVAEKPHASSGWRRRATRCGASPTSPRRPRSHMRRGRRWRSNSTCATPIFTRPLELGADVVMHSATKYLNGHSDAIAGALGFARGDGLVARVADIRKLHGLILGPFEAFLLIRGLRTLDLRVRAAAANAFELAERLSNHAAVAEVLYPGLPDHPGHAIAARQMQGGFGGMLSIRVRGGRDAAIAAAARVRLWKRATSLGGVESLIEHRASYEGPESPCPPDLLGCRPASRTSRTCGATSTGRCNG